MPIIVHHLNNSRSHRLLWLLEELGQPYEIRRYQRDPKTMMAPPELTAVHPLGRAPVLEDGGRVVAESGAAVEHLLDTYDTEHRFRPPFGSALYDRYREWLHFAEGSAMPPLLLKLVMDRIEKAPVPFFVRPVTKAIAGRAKKDFIKPQIAKNLDYMESSLAGRDWFASGGAGEAAEPTGADVMMVFPVLAAMARGGLDARYPNLQALNARIHARPAFQRALAKGGPLSLR